MSPCPSRIRVEVHDELDSTSLECARRARAGETGPLWIMAKTQTAARGRRGRAWVAPEGNFAASLIRPVVGGPEAAAQRSFVAALALYDAFHLLTGHPERFSLKWPNDVLLDGRKLAGILLELQGGQAGTPQVLILGIGVNLAAAPDPSGLETHALPPTCLAEVDGMTHPPEALLDLLGRAVEAWEYRLVAEGFEPLRKTWLERASGLGKPVVARMTNREVRGIFSGIDGRGFIVVETDDGPVSLPAAELDFEADSREMEGLDAAGN